MNYVLVFRWYSCMIIDNSIVFEHGGEGCLASLHDGQPETGHGGGAAH